MLNRRKIKERRERLASIAGRIKGTPEENRKKLDAIIESARDDKECFGKAIRKRREMLGLKVYEVANRIGINPVYITQIEKHGKLPSPVIMQKIVHELFFPERVFNIYLKLKYPALYEEIENTEGYLTAEYDKIDRLKNKKNKTPEEAYELDKRVDNFEGMRREMKNKVQKSIELLEKIERMHSDLKNNCIKIRNT